MKKHFPAFLVALGAAFCLVFIVYAGYGTWKVHALFVIPDGEIKVLEAKRTEYLNMFAKWEKRPAEDFDALKKLLGYLDDIFKTECLNFPDPCSTDLSQDLELYSSQKGELEKIFTRLEPILDGGVVLPLEVKEGPYAEVLPFNGLRSLTYGLLVSSAFFTQQGNSELATDRLIMSLTLIEGVGDCPSVVYTIMSSALLMRWQKAIIYNLPALASDDVARLSNHLKEMTSSTKSTWLGFTADYFFWSFRLESLSIFNVDNLYEVDGPFFDKPILYLFFPWFKKREILDFNSRYLNAIADCHAWLTMEDSPPPSTDEYVAGAASILFIQTFPNLERLFNHSKLIDRTNQAVLKAIEAELKRREIGGAYPIVIPIDEEQKIVIDLKRGCIVRQERKEL